MITPSQCYGTPMTATLVAALLLFPPVSQAQSARAVAPIRLSSAPVLVIGAEDRGPTYQLHQVSGALRFADGGIAVGNASTGELRLFDAKGQYIRTLSRTGGGPGEFGENVPIVPLLLGTTIVASDPVHVRINRYQRTGAILPQITLHTVPSSTQTYAEQVIGSQLVGRATDNARLDGAPGQMIRTLYRYAIYDTMGTMRAPLFELPTAERVVHQYQGSTRFPFLPFSPAPVLTAAGDRVYLLRSGAPEIEVWSSTGKRVGTLTWKTQRTRVRDIWSRWRQSELDDMRPTSRPRYADFFSDKLPLPEYVPIAEAIHADDAGRLWVVRTRLPWETEQYCDVLTTSGRYLGRVTLPERFTIHQVGRDFLLGTGRDANDVEQIQVYRLR